jgi:hypothetical protein
VIVAPGTNATAFAPSACGCLPNRLVRPITSASDLISHNASIRMRACISAPYQFHAGSNIS